MAEFEAIGKALQIPQSVLNNIDAIDKKINLIASDSEKMATAFQSAMKKMDGSALTLLNRLNAMQSVINKLDISKFAQGVQNVGRGTTQVEQFAAAISKAAEAINKYNAENRKRADVDNSKQIAQLNKEIEAMRKRTQQLEEYINKQRQANQGGGRRGGSSSSGTNSDTKALNAYNRAMAASEALVTQRINKIAKLRQAEEMLRNASGNYATQLNRINQEIARLNKLNEGQVDAYGRVIRSQRNLMNTSQQLTRQLALVFSVSAIEGYIMKLVQVRGEFELQQTALASILQNKDKADQLFGQITELAVKSPFTLKELTTYTKSLAAYQVQYEDLYDTTKMLADVSAGLGIDMQRLILAFGQVKAANILRGTEVRQFTEAGLNILGELAKYYSELEGRMISVGEVQDMVTKRMVSFGDVEEVFKRVTSAGGIFYDMQERQSQTLAGMMSNLRDNLDLMFNDIGKSNDSVIKDVVKTIADLIKNWREVAWYVEKVAIAFVAYRSIVALAALGNSKFVTTLFNISTMSGTATTKIKALGKALASLGKGLAVGGIILLVSWLTDLIREATRAQRESERLSESLRALTSMDAGNLNKTISALDDLLARYKLSNEGSQERRDIISALNSNYGEYLNFIVDETTTLEQLTTAYDEVIKRMKERSSLATLEKGYQEINQSYEEQISEGRKQLEKELIKGLRVKVGAGFTKNLLPTEEDINNIFNLLQQRIRESNEEELKGSREQRNLLQEIVTKYYGDKDLYLSQDYMKTIPLVDSFIQKKEKEAELESNINSAYKQTMQTREANLAMQERELKYEEEKKKIQGAPLSSFETQRQLQEASKQYELDKIDIQLQFGEISEASAKRAKDAIIHWATATTEDINKNLREKLSEFTEEDISRVLVTPEVQSQGVTSLIQETITQYKAQNSIIEQQEQLKEAGLRIDENVLENAKKLLAMYKARGEVLGIDWSSIENEGGGGGSSKNPELDKIKEQVAMIEKAAKAYEDYRKLYDEETAQRMVETAFKKPFDNLDLNFDMTFDAQGVIEAYRKLAQSVGGDAQEYIEGKIAEGLTDVTTDQRTKEVEEYRKQIDELFASLSNYQELEKLGLNKDLISQLFGIDVSSIQDVQDVFEKIKDKLKEYGNEGEKLIAESEKKITDAQQKELKNRLAQYAEFMRNSISERARIEIETQREIAKIQATQGMTQPMKDASIQNVRKQADIKISKLDWQDFQNSDVYTQLFQDLEYVSTSALKRIKENLDALKDSMSNLTPEQLKSINEYYSKLEEQLSTRNPFEAMRDSLREIRALQSEGRTEEVINQELLNYEAQAELYKTQISDLETIIGMKQEGMSLDSLSDDLLQRNADILGKSTDELRMQLSLRKGQLSQVQTNIGISSKDLNSYAKARKDLNALSNEIDTIRSLGKTAFGSIFDILESMGVETDSTAGILAEMGASLVDLAAQAVLFGIQLQLNTVLAQAMGVAINSALGPIGWAVMALQALSMIFSAFSKIHDNKREKQIEKEQEAVDYLEKSYEKLYDTIENGLSIYSYSDNSNLIDNLRKQIESYQKMIALEYDKKDTDYDRIKDWKGTISDLYEKMNELYANLKDELVGDFKDVSSQLADALVEAFESGEDAAEKWGDTVRDIMVEILTNILSMKYIEPAVQEILDNMFDQAMPLTSNAENIKNELDKKKAELEKLMSEGNPYKLWTEDFDNWDNYVRNLKNEISELEKKHAEANKKAEGEVPNITGDIVDITAEQLNDLLESVVDSPIADLIKQLYGQSGAGGDTLTGLSKSISGLSEQQADALAALCESIRFFTSDSNAVLHSIYNFLLAPPAESPLMQELRVQTTHLSSIDSLLGSVIKSSSGKGKIMRVEIV